MFKFISGTALGWCAARSLDDKKKMMPTTDELSRLKVNAIIFYEETLKRIEEYNKK